MKFRSMAGWLLAALAVAAACLFFLGIDRAVAWWRVRQLLAAEPQARALLIDELAKHPASSCRQLAEILVEEDDTDRAAILGEALCQVGRESGGAADPAMAESLDMILKGHRTFPPAGKEQAALWAASMVERVPDGARPTSEFVIGAHRLVELGRVSAEPAPRAATMRLAVSLAKANLTEETLSRFRELARSGIADADPRVQLAAISLATLPAMRMLDEVAHCLGSHSAEVRRGALLVLGPNPEVLNEDALLPLLHDADPQNASLAQSALVARGLSNDQIRLGRLIADPKPTHRLEVLDHLEGPADVDVAMWLKRLSHDTSPAVRSAAARAMAQAGGQDLKERLAQMAEGDPSPTVSRLARHFMQGTNR
jgi:hypothetical protein